MNLLNDIKEMKKRSRDTVAELQATADEENKVLSIFGKIREKVALLPSEEERNLILGHLNEVATRHKTKYEETQNVIMTIEREISLSSGEEEVKRVRKAPVEDIPSISFTIAPKDTFVVPVFRMEDGTMWVATSHLSRTYIINRTDIKCKHCVQSRNETFSGWFTAKSGFTIKKCRMEEFPEDNAALIGQWKADGYDIKASKSVIKLISLDQAREWYSREDIGHAKQLETLKKNCTHSPAK